VATNGGHAVMGLNHSPRIVTDGLVLCLDAASKRSYPGTGTTWTDMVGGITGSFTNGASFDSGNAGSISFDGADDKVTFTSFPQLFSGSFTFSTWVYREQSGTRDIPFGSYSQANNVNFEIAGSNAMRLYWNNGQRDLYSTATSYTGWQYLTYQRIRLSSTSSTVIMYHNTNSTYNSTFGSGFSDITTPSTFYAGSDTRTGSVCLYGKIPQISIYSRALTADEIRQNYEATVGRYT
jgi:hypothetical protein